jgi:hypothetical protein
MSRARRAGLAVLVLAPLVASCLPRTHHTGGFAGLAARDGWVDLPVRHWLLPEGIVASAVALCPRETCDGGEALAARFDLTGREADLAGRLAADGPGTLALALAGTRALPNRRATPVTNSAASRDRARDHAIRPLERNGWRGALVTLGPPGARQAHVAVLVEASTRPARLVLAVAGSAGRAEDVAAGAAW